MKHTEILSLHFLNVSLIRSLRLWFGPELRQKVKYLILWTLQTGGICFLPGRKFHCRGHHSPDGLLTQADQVLDSLKDTMGSDGQVFSRLSLLKQAIYGALMDNVLGKHFLQCS